MGHSASREGGNLSDEEDYEDAEGDEETGFQSGASPHKRREESSVDDVDAKLRALKLKYSSTPQHKPKNSLKLYVHVGGGAQTVKWVVSEKLTSYAFTKTSRLGNEEESDGDDSDPSGSAETTAFWVLRVSPRIRSKVSTEMQMKMFSDQRRVDFICHGVWAMRFFTDVDYAKFVTEFQDCLFENTYGIKPTEENKISTFGKDFISWLKPESADEEMWETADGDGDGLFSMRKSSTAVNLDRDLVEESGEEATGGDGIQSMALGALDNSFLVNSAGVQVVKNFSHGVHGKGVYVKFDSGNRRGDDDDDLSYSTPKKALLMRGETNMLLMSPLHRGGGLHQLDIETGRVVTEWKFEKDGADIKMKDIANDTKGSQLDPSSSTFLGLDDNRLCQWDMRERKGMVQKLNEGYCDSSSPVLHWAQGHQFSRGTNFQCFASTGDGSIVVGSVDGKIRLYSKTSMRQAKTAFPGLGSPVTHVDVTYDGKWIVGTTDTYLVLICTLYTDKDGNTKTGFSGRMGNKIPAPRLLKLTPVDSHTAGENSKFHGAQFSWVTENGKQERHIVATVGRFSVIWDFERVKESGHECYRNQQGLKSCYCYKIVLRDESIVDSRFMHEKFAVADSPEAPLVVATPMKVSSFSLSARSRPRRSTP